MTRALMLAVALAATLAACSPRTEEPILSGFFNASRLRDRTALQKLATTSFDPLWSMEPSLSSRVLPRTASRK